MLVQAGLCRTCSETTLLVFPRGGSSDRQICSVAEASYRLEKLGMETNVIIVSAELWNERQIGFAQSVSMYICCFIKASNKFCHEEAKLFCDITLPKSISSNRFNFFVAGCDNERSRCFLTGRFQVIFFDVPREVSNYTSEMSSSDSLG